ncbi:MAG: hypothetical protein PVI79_16305 [Gammaproteobacteria bacterium]|jgi:hypothetical protein
MISNLPAARLEIIEFDSVEDSIEDSVDDPSVEEVPHYLERLMTWYCREPSMLLATIIVSRLEWLREFEDRGEIALPEWSCTRLIRSRKYLAERCRRN